MWDCGCKCLLYHQQTTRSQQWLKVPTADPAVVCMAMEDVRIGDLIKRTHDSLGHPGMRCTLSFVKRVNAAVTRRQEHSVVADCRECPAIVPAPMKWWKGNLEVEEIWKRVGMDITHYSGQIYLNLTDCGLSTTVPFVANSSLNLPDSAECVFASSAHMFHWGMASLRGVTMPLR